MGSAPRFGRRMLAGGVLLLVVLALGAGALLLGSTHAALQPDSAALARVTLPLGGGQILRVSAVSGPHSRPVPVSLRGDQIWPNGLIPVHRVVQLEVVVKRPGWIGWLAGGTERLMLTLMTPSAHLRQHYLTLRSGAPLTLRFREPVRAVAVGAPGHLVRRILLRPLTEIRLHRSGEAGTISVAAVPRSWETAPSAVVSWFPAGATASAVANPAPGSQILPHTRITLTFSKPVAQALGTARPPVAPATPGGWHSQGTHAISFEPQGYGYGLGATVTVALPRGVRLIGAQQSASASSASWKVPGGSTLRLQQLLAQLDYLPLRFDSHKPTASTPEAQEAAAIHPPAGGFTWRYSNVPSALRGMWAPGSDGVMTRGALMAFQNDRGLSPDGVAGALVWRSLISASVEHRTASAGYTFVSVSLGGQSLNLWHDGHTVLSAPVNTGIASQPTASGTYPVFEHLRVTTMSGTNPDGSHYSDPGIQFVSYFNGGDALHAFTRAQYGFPQSLGCVEMALGPAGQVWPYTPIGTLVHVA